MDEAVRRNDKRLDFDPDILRERYLKERDKRLRPEGNAQYIEVAGKFAHFTDDPYVEPGFTREPLNDEVDVVIVGAGFGGLLAFARLQEAGVSSVRVIEAGGDVGGTWYWNRYPGAQCDIESYCYLPLLEELGYMPKEKYSFAPEIYEHSRRIAEHYNLYDNAAFQTRVTGLTWDAEQARWIIVTDRGDAIRARFVITCTGLLNRAKLPATPGIEDFEGHIFHSSRWDYAYTGGDHTGGLTNLADKRVAIIGTGATAIQATPFLGEYAEHLYVFQRTPSSVDIRGNTPTDPEWVKTLKPGWQQARRENFNSVVIGATVEEDLVHDGWTDIFRKLQTVLAVGKSEKKADERPPEELALLSELADFEKMNEIRARVDATVKSPAVAETLKPWYRQFCKRPTFNDDYLPTFNRPNVTLVDTSDSQGVQRITRTGIVANDVEYEVDCIVFATGFEAGTPWTQSQGYDVIGRDGIKLSEAWSDGMKTLHGFTTRGFPNYFLMGARSQNGLSINLTHALDDQAKHITWIVKQIMVRGHQAIEPTAEAEAAWVAEIRRLGGSGDAFLESCTPSRFNAEGRVGKGAASWFAETYAPGANAFNALMVKWRESGDMEGLAAE